MPMTCGPGVSHPHPAGKVHKAEAVPAVAGLGVLEQRAVFQINIAAHRNDDVVFAQVR